MKSNMNMEFNTFNQKWNRADQAQQSKLLEEAVDMPPGDGIIPVTAGLTSFHFIVRNRAREILGILQQKIISSLKGKDKVRALFDSALLSVHVYKNIHGNLSVQDLKLYFEILLESEGRSPFYAWKLCQSELFSMQILERITSTISEQGRLILVSQYLSSTPSVRRKYAGSFVTILKTINDQTAVIHFYADLFDKEIPSDIFLDNIKPSLRNFKGIIKTEFNNRNKIAAEFHNGEKIAKEQNWAASMLRALKAAAMLSDRIDPSVLLKLITSKRAPEFRRTIFKIIELSPVGTYFQLTDNLIDLLAHFKQMKTIETADAPGTAAASGTADLSEAMDIFKAAVISRGKYFPVKLLLQRTLQQCPDLMPLIQEELSTLSRISLCFIQEMAEDPTGKLFQNSDVQHALICGMIRKRPERVVEIITKYLKHPEQHIQQSVSELVQKITSKLGHEKKELKRLFNQMIKRARNVKIKKEKTGFFKSMFATTLGSKIESLKEAASPDGVQFNNEIIEDIDLSSTVFLSPAFVDQCVIRDVNISFASFEKSVFTNTTFYNVKMTGVQFNKTSFIKCVFIHVSADDATFSDCNFTLTSFFKSSFKSTSMKEAVLAGCRIVNTSLSRTDLSGATFATSNITLVSFVETKLDKTDFSGVTGKFCRFSPHILSKAETENSNLASRIFELFTHEISAQLRVILNDYSISNDLSMLVFTELMHHGKRMFLLKNRYAVTVAFDLFQPEQADLFELIPLLLHENIDLYKPSSRSPELAQLEYDAEWKDREKKIPKEIPHGIAGYLPSVETENMCRKYFAGKYLHKDGMHFIERRFCHIEGLFTIGSIGSIAHTAGSDIDYWVCIRSVLFDHNMKELLEEKLRAIETWAQAYFRTEIHFFIVNIEDARNSVFGESDSESSGSAQGQLLKEEFYRSMIHVAGKLPFWVTLPAKVSKNYYHDLHIRACPVPGSGGFIDFGDIHDIPAGEYFGASVWQMFKYLESPFKSVLKMGLLEKYIREKKDGRMMLCNSFKNQWMNPGLQFILIKSDPYYILLRGLVEYYEKNVKGQEFSRLVQSCFFSKICITDDSDFTKSLFGLKAILVGKCMEEWRWNKNEVYHAGNVKNWPFSEIFSESEKIEQYMVKTYKNVRNALEVSSEKGAFLTPRDTTVLGRKMFVQFNIEKSKVRTELLVSRGTLLNGLTLIYSQNPQQSSKWSLAHKWNDRAKGTEKTEELISATGIEEIAAWLIHNKLYSPDAYIKLAPNPTYVRANDIKLLLKNMHDLFEEDMKKEISGDILCAKSIVTSLFVSLNFTMQRGLNEITECCVVYRNSWGEMFCHSFGRLSGISTSADAIKKIKHTFDWLTLPERYKLFRS